MNFNNRSLLVIVVTIAVFVVLYKSIDCLNGKKGLRANSKFSLDLGEEDLKCNCDLEEPFTSEKAKQEEKVQSFDKQDINIKQSQEFKIDPNKCNGNYHDNVLGFCYYKLADQSAEEYYENRYFYPVEPIIETDDKVTIYDSEQLSADVKEYDTILDLEKPDNSYIFAY